MPLIGTGNLPEITIDPAALSEAAGSLRAAASEVGGGGGTVVWAWGSLPAGYDAPETHDLVNKMSIVGDASDDFDSALTRAAGILNTLAETLASAKQRLESLITEIGVLRQSVTAYRAGVEEDFEAEPEGEVWGPGQAVWNNQLISERETLRVLIDRAVEEAAGDLRAIGDAYGLTELSSGGTVPSLPSPGAWVAVNDTFTSNLSLAVLARLDGGDAESIRAMLEQHPEWEQLLREHPPAPTEVREWWDGLGEGVTQTALIAGAPVIIGALGGVPAMSRADANKINAETRLATLRDRLARVDAPLFSGGDMELLTQSEREAIDLEIAYLERVAAGEVNLYLYRPESQEIIEMIGNPDTADSIMSFMPGTNTNMESFYTSTQTSGITSLAHWQVNNAQTGTDVAAFVVKQGAFPYLTANPFDFAANGPQMNTHAIPLGARYAQFEHELRAISSAPLTSVEHSFGSAVGGQAESQGAHFDNRVLLAGIGMTDGWEEQPGTDYYAMQAPDDINRPLANMQAGPLGYAIAPSEVEGITELDSGIPGTPGWVPIANASGLLGPIGPIAGAIGAAQSSLDHHNQIISGDASQNRVVLSHIHLILRDAAS